MIASSLCSFILFDNGLMGKYKQTIYWTIIILIKYKKKMWKKIRVDHFI